MAISPRDCVPRDWPRLLSKATGPLGLGLDLATTEKESSNPSAFALTEKVGPLYVARLIIRWKTSKEAVTRAILAIIFEDIARLQVRPRKLCVDATNERFFAQRLQDEFSKYCPVQLIVASENVPNVVEAGEAVNFKSFTGNNFVNGFTDNLVRLPNETWIKDDLRLVKKDRGLFVADTAPDGGHGDVFDALKLSRHALDGGGPAVLSGAAVGSFNKSAHQLPSGLRNPMLRMAQQQRSRQSHA
jgi:hypothetical protein